MLKPTKQKEFEPWLSSVIDAMCTKYHVRDRKAAQEHVLEICGRDYMKGEYFDQGFEPHEAALEEVDACVANFPFSN